MGKCVHFSLYVYWQQQSSLNCDIFLRACSVTSFETDSRVPIVVSSVLQCFVMTRPYMVGHNALISVVCQSVCLSRAWPKVENGRAQQAENWQEGSTWHGWPVIHLEVERSNGEGMKILAPHSLYCPGRLMFNGRSV